MTVKNRYAMLTVDTEALPKRAPGDHVKRLIWGEHENGTAGVREMCSIADEVGGKLVFFVDACASHFYPEEIPEVIRWLDSAGHDVQLHTHSEYLPDDFWAAHGFRYRPRFLNQYMKGKAEFTIGHFSKVISDITKKPVRAFRAGSFRWNSATIRALAAAGIPLSFNNSMKAYVDGNCVHSEPTNSPYLWSNGVIEVPVTERRLFPFLTKDWWERMQFPVSNVFPNFPWPILQPLMEQEESSLLVMLLHSWSLLHWDRNGHAVYRGERRTEDFRRLLKRLTLDYDIITTEDFLDLHRRGKLAATDTVSVSKARAQSTRLRKKVQKGKSRGSRVRATTE